ncbi:MAG: hypothetical protein ACR5LD_05080 [Symbiopectobacterium sp.]
MRFTLRSSVASLGSPGCFWIINITLYTFIVVSVLYDSLIEFGCCLNQAGFMLTTLLRSFHLRLFHPVVERFTDCFNIGADLLRCRGASAPYGWFPGQRTHDGRLEDSIFAATFQGEIGLAKLCVRKFDATFKHLIVDLMRLF